MKKLFIILATFTTIIFGRAATTFATSNPPIFIKAINPGYTVDGESNVGEFIELAKSPDVETPFSLAGFVLSYTNSSGNSVILYEFPEGSWMTGESILLRFASSPGSELADLVYTKTLAFKAGPLMLTKDETIYDLVCWNGRAGCTAEFKSANPTTLLRDDKTGEFSHVTSYEPIFETPGYVVESEFGPDSTSADSAPETSNLAAEPDGSAELITAPTSESEPKSELEFKSEPEPEPDTEPILPQCAGLEFSEIFTYYESDPSEQFIEFFNTTGTLINLEGCKIRYKKKYYSLNGVVEPNAYYAIEPDFTLTKNPVHSNLLELIDIDGAVVDALDYPNGQKVTASYAKVEGTFMVTYNVTPGAANIYQKYRSCEEGKVINPDTGKCIKEVTATTEPKTCPEGSYLNTATNRCKKLVENTGAAYEIITPATDPTTNEKASFIALSAVVTVLAAGFAFFVFEFRFEIKKLFCKACRRVRRKPRPALDHR